MQIFLSFFNTLSKWILLFKPLLKKIKYRKKRELSLEEIEHYRRMAKAIARTIVVQGMLDEAVVDVFVKIPDGLF
jgi:hypothetical protein